MRVLPIPGSPTSSTSRPWPERTSSRAPRNWPISRSRPTKTPPPADRAGSSPSDTRHRGGIGVARRRRDRRERLPHGLGALRSFARGLRQQPQNQRLQRPGDLRVVPGGSDRGGVDVLRDDRDGIVAEERRAAGHQLVEQRPEGVQVRAGVRRPPQRLFRRHVAHGADHHTGHREARTVECDGQPEVAEPGRAVRRQPDVRRLQVTVNDPAPVRVLQGPAQLLGEPVDPLGALAHSR